MNKKKDQWIDRFEKEVLPALKTKYKPLKVILFGSRIYGRPNKYSDIDVIVVSEEFSKTRFINRMAEVAIKIDFPKHVDYLCYTPEEFKDIVDSSIIIKDALEKGIEVEL
jgi:uncharacterized protein